MKSILEHLFIFLVLGISTAVGADELRTIFWSRNLCIPARFAANTSGQMTISADTADNAVRFDVTFEQGTDYWAYPKFHLQSNETFADVEAIRFDIRAEAAGGFRSAYLMFNGKQPYVPIPIPDGEYRNITVKLDRTLWNPAEIKTVQIGMNPNTPKLTFFIRNLEFLTTKKIAAVFDTADTVTAEAPGSVFLQGDSPTFSLKPHAAIPAQWELYNWKDEKINRGEWPPEGVPLRLAPLPNGYYKLKLYANTAEFSGFRSFAVVPDPAGRLENHDLFFAMDSAQSWLARPYNWNMRRPANAFEVVSEVARRAGIQMVRERLSWKDTEAVRGQFQWGDYKTNADLLSARGIRISGMYHDAPPWARNTSRQLPADLVATYNYARKAAETFKGQMVAWEFWNEQDHGFSSESAWDYASAMKAASLGFKAADPKIPVAIGGFAITPILNYADVVMKSGAGEYFDIFNVHTYRPLRDFPDILSNIREYLDRNGLSDKPIWFTENGSNAEGAGRQESFIPGLRMHSPEQELLIAEYIPKMMIGMQMLGVSRDFFFVLPPYNESDGKKDWGLMRHDFTVKPGYVAFATLIDKLGEAKLLGEVELGQGIRSFLYGRKDGTQTLVYWSYSELDTDPLRPDLSITDWKKKNFHLPVKGNYEGVDLFGTPFRTNGMNVTATRFPAILEQVKGIKVTIPFRKLEYRARKQNDHDKTIVFRTELSDDFVLSSGMDRVDVKGKQTQFKLQIWNLSDLPKIGRITVSGGQTEGIPETVSIPAFGKQELFLSIAPAFNRNFQGEIRIEGMFDGRKTTPHVIPFQNLEKMIGAGRHMDMPQMLDPVNWRPNAAGKMKIVYDEPEQAIRFTTTFPSGADRWVYPEYLLQLPQESLQGAFGVEYEVKVSDAAAVQQMLLMAVEGQEKEVGNAVYLKLPAPAGKWQKHFLQFPKEFSPEKTKQLRFGLNSKADEITYWVRNIRIIYKR